MAPTTVATPTPLPPPAVVVQEATPVATEVVVPTTYVGFVVAPLLNVDVATTSAPTVLPPSLLTLMVSPSVVLAAVVSPSSSSHLHVFLDHLYTFSDADSLWGATYKLEQLLMLVLLWHLY